MYFGFSVGIYNCEIQKVEIALLMIMKGQGFYLVDNESWQNISIDKLDHYKPNGLSIRNFLIAPNNNKWCRVYPSDGSFSEVQDLAQKLSTRLDCPVMALLVDDAYGWGYELFQKGRLIDGFHTEPMISPTLEEKENTVLENQDIDVFDLYRLNPPSMEDTFKLKKYILDKVLVDQTPRQKKALERKLDLILASVPLLTSEQIAELPNKNLNDSTVFEQIFSITPEQHAKLEKYMGRPSILAEIFNADEIKITRYLIRIISELEIGARYVDMHSFFKLLNIEYEDADYHFFISGDLDRHHININDWHHLIFKR